MSKKFSIIFISFVFCLTVLPIYSVENVIIVTSIADSGPGTLRQAIIDAKWDSGPTRITFQGSSPIYLQSILPPLPIQTIIDGDISGPNGSPDGYPDVTIVAASPISGCITSEEVSFITVRGLIIRNFSVGIEIYGPAEDILIENNQIEYDMNTFPGYWKPDVLGFGGIGLIGEVKNAVVRNNIASFPIRKPISQYSQTGIHVIAPGPWFWLNPDVFHIENIKIIENTIRNGGCSIVGHRHCIIENVEVKGNTIYGDDEYGSPAMMLSLKVLQEEAESIISNVNIINNTFNNPNCMGISFGIGITEQKNKTIRDVLFQGNTIYGNQSPFGVEIGNGTYNKILNIKLENNTFSNNEMGIVLGNQAKSSILEFMIKDNEFRTTNDFAVNIWDSDMAENPKTVCSIINNMIMANDGVGIHSYGNSSHYSILVDQNSFINCNRGISTFIENEIFEGKIDAKILNNTIVDGIDGIRIDNNMTAPNRLKILCAGNTLANNQNGIHIRSRNEPEIHYNNIARNVQYGLQVISNDTVDARNNYWGAMNGPSGEGNGQGDRVVGNVIFRPFETHPISNAQPYDLQKDGILIWQNNIFDQSRDGIFYWDIEYSNLADNLYGCINLLRSFQLDHGIKRSLLSKLKKALDSILDRNYNSARRQIQDVINEITALRGHKMTIEQADRLSSCLQAVLAQIG